MFFSVQLCICTKFFEFSHWNYVHQSCIILRDRGEQISVILPDKENPCVLHFFITEKFLSGNLQYISRIMCKFQINSLTLSCLKMSPLRHVKSRHVFHQFIREHEYRTPIGSALPIMGEFFDLYNEI